MITRLGVAVAQAIIFIFGGLWIFHVHMEGSFALVLLCVMLGAIMFLGLGFTVSGVGQDGRFSAGDCEPGRVSDVFSGEHFFSSSNMPPWLERIANVLPLELFRQPRCGT